jgi:hypothetical protein
MPAKIMLPRLKNFKIGIIAAIVVDFVPRMLKLFWKLARRNLSPGNRSEKSDK